MDSDILSDQIKINQPSMVIKSTKQMEWKGTDLSLIFKFFLKKLDIGK